MAAPDLLLASSPFVGRSRELLTLRAIVPHAESEGRRIALVGGEAGSGKSRLVREFAREVSGEGVLVLYGACDAVVRTPYRPFVEALDQLVRTTDPEVLRAELGSAGGELTRIFPDLSARLGGLPEAVATDPDTERHRLHTAVTDLLAGACRRQPLVLVLEDGHWADGPTLQLLRHVSRSVPDARLLVLATFRDTEADVPAELADALADLRRSDDVVRLRLAGLTDDDVTEYVRRSAGAEVDPALAELAHAIRALTEGNAFLLSELWRTLVETDALVVTEGGLRLTRPLEEIATPESVREVVSQRLSRLDATTRDLLELAAVAGTEFGLDLLRRAAPEELTRLDALEPAVRSGMIEEVPGPGLTYRFTHELVRRALYDRLSGLRRAELHLRVGEALEPDAAQTGRALADLAHHFAAAAPIGGPERAVGYSLLASSVASGALAYEEAAAHLRVALRIGIGDEWIRAETLIELGTALFRAGTSLDSLQAFREAAEIARGLGDGELLTRAATGFEDACWRPAMHEQGARILLEEASEALSDEDSRLRVALLSGLARTLEFEGASAQAATIRNEAIAMARRIDDRQGLATVLMRAYWARSTLTFPEILAMLTEACDLAEQIGDIDIEAEAMEWRVATLLAMGEIEAARAQSAVVLAMAQRMRQPFILHVAEHYESSLALFEGRLADADAAAERSRDWGLLLTGRDASGIYGIQMFGIRREQGRLAELAPVIRVLATDDRGGSAWRPGLAALLAELGMHDDARRELARVREDGLDGFRAGLWVASLTYLADAATAVGDRDAAELLYPELEPLAGTNVMIGHGVACYGAGDRYLGMLAATLGELTEAERHFEARARAEPADGGSDVARPHLLRVRACAAPRRRARARRRDAGRGRGARRPARPHGAPGARRGPRPRGGRPAPVRALRARA